MFDSDLSLIIVLTRKCYPCACNYCNVLKKDSYNFWDDIYNNKNYFYFNLRKLVNFLVVNNINSIRFFGGEVLLKKSILIDIIDFLRKEGFKNNIFLNTNLHLFKKDDINWIRKNNIKIITSLNGFEDLHCKTRGINLSDYNKLIENIRFLVSNKIFLQINVVLFPFEESYIEKIKYILSLSPSLINLLPLMYSNMVNKDNLKEFLNKIENVLKWIKNNDLQDRFLNFKLLDKGKASFPLVTDDIVLDSNGEIYGGMIVLENFFENYKDLVYLSKFEKINNIEIRKIFPKLNYTLISNLLNNYEFIRKSVDLSNTFSVLLDKYK